MVSKLCDSVAIWNGKSKEKKMLTPKALLLHAILLTCVCMPGSKFHQTEALVDDVIEIVKLGKDIVSTLLETWHLVEQTNVNGGGGGVELPFSKGKQRKILNKINEVSRQINLFEDDVRIHKFVFEI